ncbi:3-hydroxyacyl-CoA dehydrogenase NAD-binding domain-containing protein [Aquamicrobium sp. NLF2-7]|uniref:3-hydroxyacyl-CoA dehydrogenase NAD-binding domain-containing protein n=1 Tax=Aquamicrobium sp. NLF2-7 TaxID=2918753 RepID=UPI001EFA4FC4|nr:3-hydroxyacyl-CoA dehydrogenase NAD-binding domain-containing protein [Aquamicrobium sp. NLF2-7]MCG8274379.1 3-hydroxyacyl-CoA dehydrogenase NAD-binding domain-containing protein [Aquamicrobium sp. NLF2-7]
MSVIVIEQLSDILVLKLDNSPVNALSHGVRVGLEEAFGRAEADAAIRAVVLATAGKVFCAGADITEFGQPPQAPLLPNLLSFMDRLSKPVVAAVAGAALGGGCELALACDARIATPAASFGLPEVKLGLMPGAGGTQRMPRLIGPVAALEMIAGGEPRKAEAALASGIADRIVGDEELLSQAAAMARNLAAEGRRRLSDKAVPVTEQAAFEEAAAALLKKHGLADEIAAIVASIRNSFDADFASACRAEQAAFQKLRQGARSAALRHAFLAERRSAHVGGIPAKPQKPVRTVAVIGGGTMGSGIAMSFANAGFPVTLIETDEDGAARAEQRVGSTYDISVKRGSLSAEDKTRRMANIAFRAGLAHAADADLIIEAAFEDMGVKRDIFGQLDAIAKPDAVLATNTSYLDVGEIAGFTSRPEQVVGMHFFSPANVMKLVEVVRTGETAAEVLAQTLAAARSIGKLPVVVGVCHGFVGNRMLARRSQQVDRMLLEGATPAQIDAVLIRFGFRMGPCAMGDMAGLDISWRMRKATGRRAPIADALCEAGRFGQKTGAGYYAYPQGARQGEEDPATLRLMEEVSAREGVVRRVLDDQEVLERLIYPMIDEGARILAEGIAERASDIDVIWLHGYGWPRGLGGPMHHGTQIGAATIAQRLEDYARQTGDAALQPFEQLPEMIG